MRISDWSSDVCSSDLARPLPRVDRRHRSRPALDHVNGPGLADAASLHPLVVARAAEVAEQSGGSRERRSYDSTLRRERAALTRDRIVAAGCELLQGSSIRDWRGLTIRAVAERAGVNARTVYRHLGNERGLQDRK